MLRPHPYSTQPPEPSRLDDPLCADSVRDLRESGAALAFDPVQNGWLPANATDAEIADAKRAGWPDGAAQTHTKVAADGDLTMREWRTQDADTFHALLDDPAMWAYLPQRYPAPLTQDAARDLIDLSNASNHHEVRAVLVNGTIVGQVRLEFVGLGDELQGAELSYWLGRPYWGLGLGARMVAGYVHQVRISHPALPSLYARVDDRNTASARILTRAGFSRVSADPDRPGWSVFKISF